jgi:hypothetical protein
MDNLRFKGGFGVWEVYMGDFHATIRLYGFGRVKRYELWINGGLPVGTYNTYGEAKLIANTRYHLTK